MVDVGELSPDLVERWRCTYPNCEHRINSPGPRTWWTNDDIRNMVPMIEEHMRAAHQGTSRPLAWPPYPPPRIVGSSELTGGAPGTWERTAQGKIHMIGWMPVTLAQGVEGAICPRCAALVLTNDLGDMTGPHSRWHARTDHPVPTDLLPPILETMQGATHA